VKWIIASWIVSIQGNTLEAVDGIACRTKSEFYFTLNQNFDYMVVRLHEKNY